MQDPVEPRRRTELESVFGPLELRALEALWRRDEPATVRDLLDAFPGIAYTTLMTTLDRLHRKGYCTRERAGRAFAYRPRWSRDALSAELAGRALTTLLPSTASSIRPILSLLVDEVSRRDAALLDELEALVREKRETATEEPR
ncbi:MAG: BlaI/MecI/CopY family transcriptional regulator [Vicinamibacterales bacterium]